MPERIATCCYCGRRAMLVARDHRLCCASCGAPLTRMKPLGLAQAASVAAHPATVAPRKQAKPAKPRKRKKSKPRWKKTIEGIFNEIEDIFD